MRVVNVYFIPVAFSKYGYVADELLLESYSDDDDTLETVTNRIDSRLTMRGLNVTKLTNVKEENTISLMVRLIKEDRKYNLALFKIREEDK